MDGVMFQGFIHIVFSRVRLLPYSTQITHLMSNKRPNETDSFGFEQRLKHFGACELHNNIFQKASNLDLKCLKKNVGLQLTTFFSLWIWWLLFDYVE